MDRTKPYIYKRVIAFVIDLLVVTVISGILTVMFTNTEQYDADNKKLMELTQQIVQDKENQEKYMEEFNNLNYELTKNSVSVTIITVAVSIVYYVIMSYFCHGITLGKYIFKIRIASANKKELTMLNYFLRSLIVNSILSNVVTVLLVNYLSKESFINVSSKVSNVFTLIIIISFIMMMYRNDGRGIHDLLGNTVIVDINKEKIKEENKEDNVENATIIEEKEVKDKGEGNERVIRTRNSKKK